jgi:Ca-activated chloride channel family protein
METFQRPYLLFLFIPLLGMLIYALYQNKFTIRLIGNWDRNEKKIDNYILNILGRPYRFLLSSLSYLALACLVYAASGPGMKFSFIPDETLGVDIILALDISGSMVNSYDFLPNNRLTVSKSLLKEFISNRAEDRLGLVLFAGAAYLQSPLTSDRDALKELIEQANENSIEEQGTAIGDALMLSTYRLKSSIAKSKVIILITDGVSNTGKIDPMSASFASKAYNIKVYSIGIGKEQGQYEVNYDSLKLISKETGGVFYRAESPEDLAEILGQIDSLEKDPLPKKPLQLSQTFFPNYLIWFFIFLLIEGLLKLYPSKEML